LKRKEKQTKAVGGIGCVAPFTGALRNFLSAPGFPKPA